MLRARFLRAPVLRRGLELEDGGLAGRGNKATGE